MNPGMIGNMDAEGATAPRDHGHLQYTRSAGPETFHERTIAEDLA